MIGLRRERRKEEIARAIIDGQSADGPASEASGEARACSRIGDAAREKQIHRRAEESGVLEKEGPLLRKEHFESLIDGDLRLVRFDFAEVGIEGEVGSQ